MNSDNEGHPGELNLYSVAGTGLGARFRVISTVNMVLPSYGTALIASDRERERETIKPENKM